MSAIQPVWDVFLSYASEDRDRVATPLANYLITQGLNVWFDKLELKVGDSLRERIDHGLSQSRFAVVVLSKAFFQKQWTARELNGLVQREMAGHRIILPVWHGVDETAVRQFSPPLADRFGASWSLGLEAVGRQLLTAIRPEAPARDSEHDLESPILGALESVSYELVDDDLISGLIAETNASGFVADDYEVLSMGPLDLATVTAPFEATIHLTGESEPEQMYAGHAISARISGTIRFDGSGWEVEEYEVESAEIEGMDYGPDDE
jgi:hypothetical protein